MSDIKRGNVIGLFLIFVLFSICVILMVGDVPKPRERVEEAETLPSVKVQDNFEVVFLIERGWGLTKIAYIRDKFTDIIYCDNYYESATPYSKLTLDQVIYNKDGKPMTYTDLKELYNLE